VNLAKINHDAVARWADKRNTDYRIALLIWALAISRADADEIWQNGHDAVTMAAQAIADKKNMTLRWGATTIVPGWKGENEASKLGHIHTAASKRGTTSRKDKP
jgi:hypothetical protein